MRWNEVLAEGVDIECPNCGEHVGKAKELPRGTVTCGQCGDKISNPYGYEHSKGNVEKFGRLEFSPETEEGTTQGSLKTKDGKSLGSLIQYGPKWMDYDGGNWEAYCQAIKKRKKGFPDKQKAVEWIVRQTRAAIKAGPKTESVDESDGHEYAVFRQVEPGEPWKFHSSHDDRKEEAFKNAMSLNIAQQNGRAKKGFYKAFKRPVAEMVDEAVSGLGEIPDWTGQEIGDTMPVAEFQKRTRMADQPLRAFVYKNGPRYMVTQGDSDLAFRDEAKLSKWLEDNGFTDHVGTTQVNL